MTISSHAEIIIICAARGFVSADAALRRRRRRPNMARTLIEEAGDSPARELAPKTNAPKTKDSTKLNQVLRCQKHASGWARRCRGGRFWMSICVGGRTNGRSRLPACSRRVINESSRPLLPATSATITPSPPLPPQHQQQQQQQRKPKLSRYAFKAAHFRSTPRQLNEFGFAHMFQF